MAEERLKVNPTLEVAALLNRWKALPPAQLDAPNVEADLNRTNNQEDNNGSRR